MKSATHIQTGEKMSDSKPKVSIIIPVFNVETYLESCLDSVINQSMKDIEIICVNDGSTDRSADILDDYAQKDQRIKVIHKPNSGYGHTMNCGLDAAKGEYIGFVESDDYIRAKMYAKLYKIAKQYDLDLIKADFFRFAEIGGQLKLDYNELSHGRKEYCNKVLKPADNQVVFKFIMNTWSGIYKRSFIEKNHIRHNETPGASYQDNGFFFQTFCLADRVWFLNEPLYMNRRDNPNSSISNKGKVFCMRDEYEFIRRFLEQDPERFKMFINTYWLIRYYNYLFTLRRVADEFKPMFLAHFYDAFKQAKRNGELDKGVFSALEWEMVSLLVSDPDQFMKCHLEESEMNANQSNIKPSSATVINSIKRSGIKVTTAKILSKFGKMIP